MRYLLDTDTCMFLMRGNRKIAEMMDKAGFSNCAISEITKAELLTGMHYAKARNLNYNETGLINFLNSITVIPVSSAIERFSEEKARLIHEGMRIEDFDLLIGCTAVACSMVMVTNNISHFERISSIVLQNWKT